MKAHSKTAVSLFSALLLMGILSPAHASLVESKNATNRALLIGVPDDLQGIDKDLEIMAKLVERPEYRFRATQLWNQQGTPENIAKNIESLSSEIKDDGTLLIYYSGHGVEHEIETYGTSLKIKTLAETIAASRSHLGPLARLVVIFDSCRSGTFIDPFQKLYFKLFKKLPSQLLAKEMGKDLERPRMTDKDWKKVFIFASSQADEDSQPTENGSQFTLALKKSFDELSVKNTNGEPNATMAQWAEKTIEYTEDHVPVPHFYPSDWAKEKIYENR